jgi:hypothetical protein
MQVKVFKGKWTSEVHNGELGNGMCDVVCSSKLPDIHQTLIWTPVLATGCSALHESKGTCQELADQLHYTLSSSITYSHINMPPPVCHDTSPDRLGQKPV